MQKKVLIFGMDGNVLDNYSIKANCAGKAMSKNAREFFSIDKKAEFFAKVYIATSGMNSLEQFRVGYKKVTSLKITEEILRKTELDFRKFLEKAEKKIKIFPDVKKFLQANKNQYIFCITTTVPISKVVKLVKTLSLNKYFQIICARHGFWQNGIIRMIRNFDKGKKHYEFIQKTTQREKSDLIAISSTRTDILNAKKYKITSVALEHIFKRNILLKLKPDYIFNNCNQLKKIL